MRTPDAIPGMWYGAFLNRIVEEGISAAKADYTKPEQAAILRGAIAGFEACRGRTPQKLAELLAEARAKESDLLRSTALPVVKPDEAALDRHWELRGFSLEVEWVANVVSAALMNKGAPTIVPPTARGVLKAAEILGVR